MNQERALELLEELNGDEHEWVDYKEDYYIKGAAYLEGEFVRDLQALANALTSRDERYLFIGCDNEGNVIGVDGDAGDQNSEPRHVLSFEEDDLQEIIDARLTPGPRISLHTFQEDGDQFVVLVVRRVKKPPCVTTSQLIDDDGDTKLRENELWIRKASGKKEANRDELENLIEYRIDQVRDSLMKGIRRVVELDPDTIAAVGDLQPQEGVEADITFEVDKEGDYTVNSRLTDRTFHSLKSEVDADLGKRDKNESYYVDIHDLMRYYANHAEVPKDPDAIQILAESALYNWLPGTFWLAELETDEHREFLCSVPDENPIRNTVCKSLVLAGEQDAFDDYISNSSSMRYPRFRVRDYRDLFDQSLQERYSELRSQHPRIRHGAVDLNMDYAALDGDTIGENIPKIAAEWIDCGDDSTRSRLKYVIKDLELVLTAELLGPSEDAN